MMSNGINAIQINQLQSGVYFVQVISDNKVISNKKILIQNCQATTNVDAR